MNTYVFGDLHGCYDKLQQALGTINPRIKDDDRMVFLGDYIDRGPNSKGVLDTVMRLNNERPEYVICLRGNHEQMLLDSIDGMMNDLNVWIGNGGKETLNSMRVEFPWDISPRYISWLRQTRFSWRDQLRFYVHAGIRPDVALVHQRREDLMWIRKPFLMHHTMIENEAERLDNVHGLHFVHGHTVNLNGPELLDWRTNLDTGAVFGGKLTVGVFNDKQAQPVEILQW